MTANDYIRSENGWGVGCRLSDNNGMVRGRGNGMGNDCGNVRSNYRVEGHGQEWDGEPNSYALGADYMSVLFLEEESYEKCTETVICFPIEHMSCFF